MMLREEYDKLFSINQQTVKPGRRIISSKDHSFARHFGRYIRTDYQKETRDFIDEDCPWIGIDIFPIDFVSSDNKLFHKQVKEISLLRKIMLLSLTKEGSGNTRIKKSIKSVLRPITRLYGTYRAVDQINRLAQQYNTLDHKEYIACVCGMYGLRERWKYDEYLPQIEIRFESGLFPVPQNYDIYLTNLFGNYMQLPSEDKRKQIDYKVLRRIDN